MACLTGSRPGTGAAVRWVTFYSIWEKQQGTEFAELAREVNFFVFLIIHCKKVTTHPWSTPNYERNPFMACWNRFRCVCVCSKGVFRSTFVFWSFWHVTPKSHKTSQQRKMHVLQCAGHSCHVFSQLHHASLQVIQPRIPKRACSCAWFVTWSWPRTF